MTTPPPARRRFLPEPVETSARSSKSAHQDQPNSSSTSSVPQPPQQDNMVPQTKPRKFLPQPVEETIRSSKQKGIEHIERSEDIDNGVGHQKANGDLSQIISGTGETEKPTPRRFAVEPVETTTTKSRRKFAPEPIENSARSSKEKKQEEDSVKPKRRFAPEPVESTARSSKDKKQDADLEKPRRKFAPEPVETSTRNSKDTQDTDSNPKRRFAPEPVETTTTRRRRQVIEEEDEEDNEPIQSMWKNHKSITSSSTPSRSSSGGRKFSPELLETAKGSYRKDHSQPLSPQKSRESHTPSPPPSEPEEQDEVTGLGESKFSAAALAKKHHEEHRRHSFMVPDLPMIESDSGSDSEAPSLTDATSVDTDFRNPSKARAGDSYTDYVLRLAAETATEKELQEQAMAAYINERPHEPVSHFAISHEDDDETINVGKLSGEAGVDVRTFRRSSVDDHNWEMENMRKHHKQLEEAKRQFKADTAGQSRFSAAALVTRHHLEEKDKKHKKQKAEVDQELARQRAAASPPMLGDEIVFPFTISPKMTRCETDQAPRPRTHEDDSLSESGAGPGLWNTKIKINNAGAGGLWMGMCHKTHTDSCESTPNRSGLQTPFRERANPFDVATPIATPRRHHREHSTLHPPSPPRSQGSHFFSGDAFTISIDKKLQFEQQIEDEFPNSVITQIYNYLSLGYPSLAHEFDDELSKISRIPVEDLRRDDENVDVKGYVGAPEGDGVDEDEVVGRCKRWEALRVYVREWARQSPNFADERKKIFGNGGVGDMWGATVRKGSWGQ